MELRDYQQDCIEKIEAGWWEHSRQLAILPTGAGKTIIFSKLAERQEGRVLILCHRDELIEQAIHKLFSATGIIAEKEKADSHASRGARVVVASVQTMARRMKRWRQDHFALIVCDEAHRSVSDSWGRVIGYFCPFARLLGVTATPDRADKKSLGELYETIAFEITMDELIKRGYLVPIVIKTSPLEIDMGDVGRRAGDFAVDDVGHAIEPYLDQIAEQIKELAGDRRTLVFVPLISTSHKFLESCKMAGLTVAHVDGKSDDRREVLERFARGEFQVLSNAMLLTEGFDDPGIECVVNLRLTGSRSLFTQIVGRGTRLCPGKENLLLIDFLWLHTKHNLMRPAHISGEDDETIAAMVEIAENKARATGPGEQEELPMEGLQSEAAAKREANLAKHLAKQTDKKAETVDAVEFCRRHGAAEIEHYRERAAWERERPTSKQIDILMRHKIDIDTVRGKGHASQIIDAIFEAERNAPATPRQKGAMRRAGHPDADRATREQARQFFARRNQAQKEAV
tara:strand:- start:3641 stop:5182 length:1542 start_codon:yes stop_codon:yes gene_type:complete